MVGLIIPINNNTYTVEARIRDYWSAGFAKKPFSHAGIAKLNIYFKNIKIVKQTRAILATCQRLLYQ